MTDITVGFIETDKWYWYIMYRCCFISSPQFESYREALDSLKQYISRMTSRIEDAISLFRHASYSPNLPESANSPFDQVSYENTITWIIGDIVILQSYSADDSATSVDILLCGGHLASARVNAWCMALAFITLVLSEFSSALRSVTSKISAPEKMYN